MFNGIKHPQTRIGAIARKQDHFNAEGIFKLRVQRQHLFHHGKRLTRLKRFVLFLDLVSGIGLKALLFENPMRLIQIEQRSGRDCDDQLLRAELNHYGQTPPWGASWPLK